MIPLLHSLYEPYSHCVYDMSARRRSGRAPIARVMDSYVSHAFDLEAEAEAPKRFWLRPAIPRRERHRELLLEEPASEFPDQG